MRAARHAAGTPRWACWAPWPVRVALFALLAPLVVPAFVAIEAGRALVEVVTSLAQMPGECRYQDMQARKYLAERLRQQPLPGRE